MFFFVIFIRRFLLLLFFLFVFVFISSNFQKRALNALGVSVPSVKNVKGSLFFFLFLVLCVQFV